MKEHKATAWDVGQDLISCFDHLLDKAQDVECAGYPRLARLLRKQAFEIGAAFNKHGSHGFGLPDAPKRKPRAEGGRKKCRTF